MMGWLQKTWVEGFDRLFDRNLFRLDKEIKEKLGDCRVKKQLRV